jgi:hypothetical protein
MGGRSHKAPSYAAQQSARSVQNATKSDKMVLVGSVERLRVFTATGTKAFSFLLSKSFVLMARRNFNRLMV